MDGNLQDYGIFAGDTVIASTGNSMIIGDLGSLNAVTNPTYIDVTGQNNVGAIPNTIQDTYNEYIALVPDITSSASNIGNTTFNPGTILLTSASVTIGGASPSNQVTLDGGGTYIFQIPNGGLTTDTTSAPVSFNLINGAAASYVYWVINGNVNLQTIGGNITTFIGSVITQQSITLGVGTTSAGSLAAPSSTGDITLNSNVITCRISQYYLDTVTDNYIILETTLADANAIQINAVNTYGGISINSGFGGIKVKSTNTINMTSTNASSLVVTGPGNVTVKSESGLVNIDSDSGINIGQDGTYVTPVVNIGNTGSNTSVNLYAGTGGIQANTVAGGNISLTATGSSSNFTLESNADSQDLTIALNGSYASRLVLNSQGTGADSIMLDTSAGGLTASIAGAIDMVSSSSSGSAFNVYTLGNNGGINLVAGNQGVIINSYNGGTVAIGTFTPATVLLGTAGPNSTTIGNTTSTSTVAVNSGTGGTNVSSSGIIGLSSTNTTTNAITLDSSGSTGGIVLTSGVQGIYLSSNGGPLALGSFTGGDVYIGTAAISRTVSIGNIAGTSALVLSAGMGGIAIGNDSSTGEINIGNTANDKTIVVGNNNTNTRIFQRYGTAGFIKHQEAETPLSDADSTLTIAQLLKNIFTIAPTVTRALTLPTSADAVAGISGVSINDAIDFTIINNSTPANEAHLTITSGTGGSIIGNTDVASNQNSVASYYTSGSGTFRMRFTNVSSGTEAYVVYRIS